MKDDKFVGFGLKIFQIKFPSADLAISMKFNCFCKQALNLGALHA
jgi:hypothetical protein